MERLTIVEHYVMAAAKRAVVERQDDGSYTAFVPECPGVLAFGADIHACARDLFDRLADWVRVSLENRNSLPIIDGHDLNSDAGRLLASYHRMSDSESDRRQFYADEDELKAAFIRHGEIA